ncbi:transposable element Tc1 transposase [Trichonephila clavipes]|nr:transposable element Tc1 transposase [Trichonephila clavipes]
MMNASRTVSKRTVQLSFHRMDLGSLRPSRVPSLTARHWASRLAWAREHRDWSIEDRKRVAWSDESRFRLLNANGRLRKWRQAHEAMAPACQDGNVHENCTSHKYWLATGWLDENSSEFSFINWPPRSPDLNPFEHLWHILEHGMKDHHTAPTKPTELWAALVNIWQVIPMKRFQKLVESMPRHVVAVMKTRGGSTRY